jgi:hypothetical protein
MGRFAADSPVTAKFSRSVWLNERLLSGSGFDNLSVPHVGLTGRDSLLNERPTFGYSQPKPAGPPFRRFKP